MNKLLAILKCSALYFEQMLPQGGTVLIEPKEPSKI
jgi:hypothetical protein